MNLHSDGLCKECKTPDTVDHYQRCARDWESQWEWESHGNPMGTGQELNKTWEWE